MRIQFCGADRTVTGSCHLIDVNGLRLLLDMGMYQGPREEARRLNFWLPDGAKKVDALILSHGHLDHCGKIPVLTRAGYDGPIHCTPATAEVARIVLEDSAEIQEEDAIYLNRRGRAPGEELVRPLYVKSDIPRGAEADEAREVRAASGSGSRGCVHPVRCGAHSGLGIRHD